MAEMEEINQIQIDNTIYNIKDAMAGGSTFQPIILTMGSEDNLDNNEDFKSFATSSNLALINKAIEERNPFVLVKGYDTDGMFFSHATINVDGGDVFVRVHGNPYRWDTEDDSMNIIAVDYYIYNDKFWDYRLITASVGDAVKI